MVRFIKLFGAIETDNNSEHAGIGTITGIKDGDKYNVAYVPPPLTEVRVKTVTTSASQTKGGVEGLFELDLVDTKISSFEGSYTNTQADVRRAFGLFHGGDPIFFKTLIPQTHWLLILIMILLHFQITSSPLAKD